MNIFTGFELWLADSFNYFTVKVVDSSIYNGSMHINFELKNHITSVSAFYMYKKTKSYSVEYVRVS